MLAASSHLSPSVRGVPGAMHPLLRAFAVFEGVLGVAGALALGVLVPASGENVLAADVLFGIALALGGAWLGWRLWSGRPGALGAMLAYVLVQVPHAAWGGAMWKFVLGPYYVLRWYAGGGRGASRGVGIQFDFAPPLGETPWVGVNVVAAGFAVLLLLAWARVRRRGAGREAPGRDLA